MRVVIQSNPVWWSSITEMESEEKISFRNFVLPSYVLDECDAIWGTRALEYRKHGRLSYSYNLIPLIAKAA